MPESGSWPRVVVGPGSVEIGHPGYVDVDFLWRVGERRYEARFLQWIRPDGKFSSFSFLVCEIAFCPTGEEMTFESTESKVFQSFRPGIIEVIRHLAPTIGFADYSVDYEEAYYCEGPRDERDVVLRRGNYLPWSILNRWNSGDMATLLEAADIATEIEGRGLLFFCFPLMDPLGWTGSYIHRLMRIRELYDRNSVWSMSGSDAKYRGPPCLPSFALSTYRTGRIAGFLPMLTAQLRSWGANRGRSREARLRCGRGGASKRSLLGNRTVCCGEKIGRQLLTNYYG